MAVGRKPFTDGLDLENTKIKLDPKGRIKTDTQLRTAEDNIYVIGDVIEGAMLVHKAEKEGVLVAEVIHGEKPHINYNLIPGGSVYMVGSSQRRLYRRAIERKRNALQQREVTDIALGKISYAHPTYSEALKDAYLMASGSGALNI